MQPRRLRPALLATLATLLLAAGLTPTHASASDGAAEGAEGATITTVLHPGWNMVGWVGPATPTSELFEALPQLPRVSAWDAEAGIYRRAFRSDYAQLASLTPGLGLWLHIDGDATVEWTRGVSDEPVLLSLAYGRNLVGWTGGSDIALDEVAARFGDAYVRTWRWDGETQQFAHHRPGVSTPGGFTGLRRGGALWIVLTEDARWWQSGLGRTVFEFADEVTPEHRDEAYEELTRVITFFAERFGSYSKDLTVSMPHTDGCWARPGLIKLTDLAYVCAAHEYFHALQFELADATPWGPHWLVEGSATYAEEAYSGELEFRRRIASASASHAPTLRNPGSTNPLRLYYHLGFLAAEWLVNRAGEASLLEYYRLLPSTDSWEDAFATAFGLTVNEFHDAFEAYRADVAPPLPHLTDDEVQPVVEFLGDVPAQIQDAIRAEMASVHRFLIDRFEAEPSEYSAYVGSHWDHVAHRARRLSQSSWWDDPVRRLSLPLEWEGGCLVGYTGWIAYSADCAHAPDYRTYISWHLRALLQENRILDLPTWLDAGAGGYIALAYRTAEAVSHGAEFDEYLRSGQRSSTPLRDLAVRERWEEGDVEEHRAVSILAVSWLLERAGERALFKYFGFLPRLPGGAWFAPEGSVEAAFEQAFGLTIEDFYEQFEAYRATLQ